VVEKTGNLLFESGKQVGKTGDVLFNTGNVLLESGK